MKKLRKISLFTALLAAGLLGPGLAAPAWSKSKTPPAPQTTYSQASTLPAVTVSHWRKTAEREKQAFLLGFISMLDLEKEWQGGQLLPMKDSLIGNWSRGLNGLTISQIAQGIDEYIAANPGQPDKPVLEVMWFKFVQPTVKETLGPEVKAKGRQLRNKAGR